MFSRWMRLAASPRYRMSPQRTIDKIVPTVAPGSVNSYQPTIFASTVWLAGGVSGVAQAENVVRNPAPTIRNMRMLKLGCADGLVILLRHRRFTQVRQQLI